MSFLGSLGKIAGVIAAPFTGGASLLGTALSSGADLLGGILTNKSNEAQSAKQMAFQADMSGTAHQREVQDLVAAGLNPMLSVNAGASTPSGSAASLVNPVPRNMFQSALDAKATMAQIDQIKAQTRKTKVETVLAAKNAPIADIQNQVLSKAVNSARSVGSAVQGVVQDVKAHSKWSPSTPVENWKSWFNFAKGKLQ